MAKTYYNGRMSMFGNLEEATKDVYDRFGQNSSFAVESVTGSYYDKIAGLNDDYIKNTRNDSNIFDDFRESYQFNPRRLADYREALTSDIIAELMSSDDPHMAYTADMINEQFDLRTQDRDFKRGGASVDSYTKMFEGSTADVMNYRPMPELDLPIIPAHTISNVAKDIISTEVVKAPKFNKHLYQQFIIDTVTQEEFQVDKLFYGELKDANDQVITPESVSSRGEGLPIDKRPVALPTKGATATDDFNVITTLTEGTTFDKLDWQFRIIGFVVGDIGAPDADGTYPKSVIEDGGDGTYYPLPRPLSFDPYTGALIGTPQGDAAISFTDVDGNKINDKLVANANLAKGTVNVFSCYGQIKAVIFDGKLSNEFNNRTLGVLEKTTLTEFNIPQAVRFSHNLTREELDDFQVFMKKDLTVRVVELIKDNSDLFEDQSVLDFYERDWLSLQGSKVVADIFNYESFGQEVVCGLKPPVGYAGNPISFQTEVLQWYIQSLLTAISEKAKLDVLSYVLMANPIVAAYLNAFTEWTTNAGGAISGITLNHSYGKGIVNGVTIRVVVSTRFKKTADVTFTPDGSQDPVTENLPFIDIKAFPTDNQHMTYKHWKYTSYVVQTPSDAGFLAPVGGVANPGGQYMVITSARRYGNDRLQGIAARVYLDYTRTSDLNPFSFGLVK
jgi:hypothetical protein